MPWQRLARPVGIVERGLKVLRGWHQGGGKVPAPPNRPRGRSFPQAASFMPDARVTKGRRYPMAGGVDSWTDDGPIRDSTVTPTMRRYNDKVLIISVARSLHGG